MFDKTQVGTFVSAPNSLVLKDGHLGAGCFGSVSKSTVPGLVVKAVEKFWIDGWFAWAMYCLKHQGKAGIPTILALRLDFNEGNLWALMEELTPFSWDENPPTIRAYSRADFERNVGKAFGRLKSIPGHVRAVMEALPEQAFNVDLHRANYMKRGNKTIVTDPLVLTSKSGDWLKTAGQEAEKDALVWARQTLDTFMPKPDPRVFIVGSPEGVIEAMQERQKKQDEARRAARCNIQAMFNASGRCAEQVKKLIEGLRK